MHEHKMAKSLAIVLIFLSVIGSSRQEDYCYAEDENPYLYFSSATSYSNVRSLKFEAAKNCEPIYTWALIKNGVTYMSKNQIDNAEKLPLLRDEILKNYQEKRGKLCEKDLINLQNWNLKLDRSKADQLATSGLIDQVQLARRLKSVFDSLFKFGSKELYEFQTSNNKVAQDSGLAFVGEILQTNIKDKDVKELGIVENSMLNENSNQEIDLKEMKEFFESSETTRIIKEISTRLGFEKELTFDIITSMYDVCSFETAWGTDPLPPFCAAFLPDELKMMEYGRDLRYYYSFGYANAKIEIFGNPLFEDMLTKIIDASDGKFAKKGSFYFSESSPIAAVLKKLDLYHDEQPPRHDNYEIMKTARKWRSSFIDCFSANIIAVLYSCPNENENEKRIEFYHNENSLKTPHCEKNYCTIEELKKLKAKPISEPESEKGTPKEKNEVEPQPKTDEKKKEEDKPKDVEPQPKTDEKKKEEDKPKDVEPQPKNDEKNKENDDTKNKPQNDDKNEDKNVQKNNEEADSQNSGVTTSFINLGALCLCVLFSIFTL